VSLRVDDDGAAVGCIAEFYGGLVRQSLCKESIGLQHNLLAIELDSDSNQTRALLSAASVERALTQPAAQFALINADLHPTETALKRVPESFRATH
jgi:hypothetical protein